MAAGPRPSPRPDLLQVRDGQWTRRAPDNGGASGTVPLLSAGWAGVTLDDGTEFTNQGAGTRVEERAGGIYLRTPGAAGRPELRWSVVVEQAAQALTAHLWLEVENTTDRALLLARMNVLVAPGGLRHIAAANLELAQTGWQSCSYATPSSAPPRPAPGTPNPMRPAQGQAALDAHPGEGDGQARRGLEWRGQGQAEGGESGFDLHGWASWGLGVGGW